MRVLFWLPPWPINGDPVYFKNTFIKHLSLQANILSKYVDVDFALPAYYLEYKHVLDNKVSVITLPLELDYKYSKQYSDIYQEIYRGDNSELLQNVSDDLSSYLIHDYDIILTWENPIDYLKFKYPDALLVSQMPGIFSRPPYPHTVIFDIEGLYKDGFLSRFSEEIMSGTHLGSEDKKLARAFFNRSWESLHATEPSIVLNKIENIDLKPLKLLPLQTSYHYAFKNDTGYKSQLEFLYDYLENDSAPTIITQYVSKHYQDSPLNELTFNAVKQKYPSAYFYEDFNAVDSVSQYLLTHVDTVVSASSSLGLQAFCLGKNLEVVGDTFQSQYATKFTSENKDASINTLGFILSYHQVLASKITTDGKFLYKLLNELLQRKKAGEMGLNQLVNYTDIDSRYNEQCLAAFRPHNTQSYHLKDIDSSFIEEQKVLNAYNSLLYADATEIVSFDIFDTLVKRGVEKPVDVFKFLDAKVKIMTNGAISKFSQYRSQAENEARRVFSNKDEITLENIYTVLAELLMVNRNILNPVMTLEIETELSMISRREFGFNLYEKALRANKKVILISDMYLSREVIERVLDKAGIQGYSELFVSSEYNATKKKGNLYEVVISELATSPNKILHIGDNKQTDINSATKFGLQTFRWSSAIEWFRLNKYWKDIYNPRVKIGSKERSVLAGLTALGLYDSPQGNSHFESLTGGKPYNFGYAILAPMLLGYITWLKKKAESEAVTDLYFLSREGYVLKEFFEKIYPNSSINIHYLYCSRRAVRVASLMSVEDVLSLAAEPYTPGVTVKSLLENRFGILIDDSEDDRKLDRSLDDTRYWTEICKKFSSRILEQASEERENYLVYLADSGITNVQKPAIVDIGWGGNMQGYLSRLLNRDIQGYYYATLTAIEFWKRQGVESFAYLGEGLPNYHNSDVIRNRHFLEYVICHTDSSFVRMSKTDGELVPKFRKEDGHLKRQQFISSLHKGAIDFAEAFDQHFSLEKDYLYIYPELAEAPFSYFIKKPQLEDAKLFQDCFFEDGVGGLEKKYIVMPTAKDMKSNSVLSEAASLIYQNKYGKPNVGKEKVKIKAKDSKPSELAVNVDHKFEYWFIKRFLSERKVGKYLRDRDQFFNDSKNRFIQFYYNKAAK